MSLLFQRKLRQKALALLNGEIPHRPADRAQRMIGAMDDKPFAHDRQTDDVEDNKTAHAHFGFDRMSRDECQTEARHNGLLDRLVRSDFDSDVGLAHDDSA